MSRSLPSGAHSRDPLAHPSYACSRLDLPNVFAGKRSGAIDLGLLSSDSVGMEMRCPNWNGYSWLPYCWAILIFSCSRVVVALGLVFSQKYLAPLRAEVWSAG